MMQFHRALHLPFFIAALLLLELPACADPISEDDKIDLDRAIRVLEACESQFLTARWQARSMAAELSDPADMTSIVAREPSMTDADVIYDAKKGRYRIDRQYISRWIDGAAPYISGRECMSFDGSLYRSWKRAKHGIEIPRKDEGRASGNISSNDVPLGRTVMWLTGIAYMPPLFYDFASDPEPLSALLRRAKERGIPISVSEDDAEQWIVQIKDEAKYYDTMRVRLDPARACLLLGVEWLGESNGKVWRKLHVTARETSGNLWAPETLELVHLLDNPPNLARVDYENVQSNVPVTDELFRCSFPAGAIVDDVVKGTSYTVGSTPAEEAASVQVFMERHGLETRGTTPAGGGIRMILIAVNAFAILIIAGLLLRRRLKSRMAPCIMLVLCCAQSKGTYGVEARLPRATDSIATPWVVSHSPGERIVVTQCGFHVAIFSLEWFDIEYIAGHVADALRPDGDEQYVSVQDLKDVLSAHDLVVTARRDVTVAGLNSALTGDNLAILPVYRAARQQNHYVIALRDRSSEVIIVDVLHSIFPLDKYLSDSMLEPTNGVVLFVTSNGEVKLPMAARVDASPSAINLGTFLVSGEDAGTYLNASFSITNNGSVPVMVNSIKKDCGCAHIDWNGGMVHSGETRRIDAKVYQQLWGIGSHTKQLLCEFADGSHRRITIEGVGVIGEGARTLRVRPSTARIDVTGYFDEKVVRSAEVEITSSGGLSSDGIECHTSSPWLMTEVTVKDDERARLAISVDPSPAFWSEMAASPHDELKVDVHVSRASCGGDGEQIKVAIHREPFHEVSRGVVLLTRKNDAVSEFSISPVPGRTARLHALRAWSEPEGLEITTRPDLRHGDVVCNVAADGLSQSLYIVYCEVESELGEPGLVKVLALMREQ